MINAKDGAQTPAFLSSHPTDSSRIQTLQSLLPTRMSEAKFILTLNVGSSSLKFALFDLDNPSDTLLGGNIEGVADERRFDLVLKKLAPIAAVERLAAVGHRIVHGGPNFSVPQRVNVEVINELKRLVAFAPEHLPAEIALIELVARRLPPLVQVVCFDTAFHRDLPRVAQLLPIPRCYESAGIRRYGFHGLSYEFLRQELVRLGDPAATKGRVILAHLGSGASLAAMLNGQCVDTSMGFTPSAGLMMGTRAGDLDPGLLCYLARKMSTAQLDRLVNHESGLLGVSEISADMRELLRLAPSDLGAAEAIALFCQQAKKWIGSFAAVLDGLDTLVFAGGIGEHNATIRRRICVGLDFLGLEIDDALNAEHAAVISAKASRVTVRVIPTNEALVIARAVSRLLQPAIGS